HGSRRLEHGSLSLGNGAHSATGDGGLAASNDSRAGRSVASHLLMDLSDDAGIRGRVGTRELNGSRAGAATTSDGELVCRKGQYMITFISKCSVCSSTYSR